jgi:hypothetical protein
MSGIPDENPEIIQYLHQFRSLSQFFSHAIDNRSRISYIPGIENVGRAIRPESIESNSFERAKTTVNCLNTTKPNRFTNKLDQNRNLNTKDKTS